MENTSGYDNKNIKVYGGIYEIKTDTEVRFNKAVTLTLKYDEAWLEPGQDINDIKIYWYNERTGSWEYLGGVLDKANKTISITLKHLSKYTLGFDEKMLQMKDMPGRWSYDIVNRLISIGVVNGVKMEDGYYYYPERPITRQEFAKLIVLASGVPLADRSEANYFADVSQIGDWAVPYIATATKRQWLKGVPEAAGMSVHPLRNITRAEAATVIGRIIEEAGIESESLTQSVFTDLNDVPDWALKYVNLLNMHEIILGYPDGTFRPNNFINREEAAAIIARMLDLFHATGKYLD
ncbi:MAG: S-layer homology domain-containing protein [Clostridiaceae bacterium]|nr:S-layer homology domain-containing protein [Clostridiaceae bacterium]